MSKVRVSDIRSELRPSAKLLKLKVTASSGPAFERYDRQCIRKYRGKWRSFNTVAEEKAVVREDGSILRILVARSEKRDRPGATGLLWLHDGGFAYGVPEQESMLVDMICGDGSCVAILPDYTKSIESPYPAALSDCLRILKWMRDNADELGISRNQLFVGGTGAGGGLAAALCLYEREKRDVHIAFQMTVAPMLDDRMESESSVNNNAPVWDSRKNRAAWDLYLKDMQGKVPVYAAPGRETDLRGMPAALGMVGDLDPVKDETVLYFARMKKAGVPVSLRVYHGCYHSFETTAIASNVSMNAVRYLVDSFRYAQKHYFARNEVPAQVPGATEELPKIEEEETELLPSNEEEETELLPSNEEEETELLPSNEEEETELLPSNEESGTEDLPSDGAGSAENA